MGEDNGDSKDLSRRSRPPADELEDSETLSLDLRAMQEKLRDDSRLRDEGQRNPQAKTIKMSPVEGPTAPVAVPPQLLSKSRGEGASREELLATTELPSGISFEARVEADGSIRLPASLLRRGKISPGMVLKLMAWVADEG